jgi:hypothetical protein
VRVHDIDIYLTVLYIFITILFMGLRQLGSRWTTWFQKIDLLKDSELREWYISNSHISAKELDSLTDPAVLKLAHQALHHQVVAETRKNLFAKKSEDPLVLKMTKSFEATDFLMVCHSK